MCLIAIAYRVHPDFPLLVAANRDEFHRRPTAASSPWKDSPDLLAGRDLQAGGTWMGITRTMRFAAVTNRRGPPDAAAAPRSRGLLTLDYLRGDLSPRDHLRALEARAGKYAGFDLLLADREQLCHFSNIERRARPLSPGVYSLSNAGLNGDWPKEALARSRLAALPRGEWNHRQLQAVVGSRTVAGDDRLPDAGVGLELERLLSAQFIVNAEYGTRATTSLWRDGAGKVDWEERSFDAAGRETTTRRWCISPLSRAGRE